MMGLTFGRQPKPCAKTVGQLAHAIFACMALGGLATAGGCSSASVSIAGGDCPTGQAVSPTSGVCTVLCTSQADCGELEICQLSFCETGTPDQLASRPRITGINGDSTTADGAIGHGANLIASGIVLTGENLSPSALGFALTLIDAVGATTDLTGLIRAGSSTRLEFDLPGNNVIVAGETYTIVVQNESASGETNADQITIQLLQGAQGDQGPQATPESAVCLAGCEQVVPGIGVLGTIRARATFPADLTFPAEGPNRNAVIRISSGTGFDAVDNFGPTASGNGVLVALLQRQPTENNRHELSTEGTGLQFFTTLANAVALLQNLTSTVFVVMATQGDLMALADVATVAAGETETNLSRFYTVMESLGAPQGIRDLRSGEPFVFVGYKRIGVGNGHFFKSSVEDAAYDLNGDTTPDGRSVEARVLLLDTHLLGPPARSPLGGLATTGGPLLLDGDAADSTSASFTEVGGKVTVGGAGVVALAQGGLQVGAVEEVVDLGTDALTVGGTVTAGGDANVSSSVSVGGGFGSTGVTITDAGALSADGVVTVGGDLNVTGGLTLGGGFGSTGITVTDAGVLNMDGMLTANGGLALGGTGLTGVGTLAATSVALSAAANTTCSTAGTVAFHLGQLHVCDGSQLVQVGLGSMPSAAADIREIFDINPAGNGGAGDLSGFTLNGNGSHVAAAGGVDAHYLAAASSTPTGAGAALTSANMILPPHYTFEIVLQSDTYTASASNCPMRHGNLQNSYESLHICFRSALVDIQDDGMDNNSVRDNLPEFDEYNTSTFAGDGSGLSAMTPGTKYHLVYVHETNNGRSVYVNGVRQQHMHARTGTFRSYATTQLPFYFGGHDTTSGATDSIQYFRARMYAHPLSAAQVWDACKTSGFESGANVCGTIP